MRQICIPYCLNKTFHCKAEQPPLRDLFRMVDKVDEELGAGGCWGGLLEGCSGWGCGRWWGDEDYMTSNSQINVHPCTIYTPPLSFCVIRLYKRHPWPMHDNILSINSCSLKLQVLHGWSCRLSMKPPLNLQPHLVPHTFMMLRTSNSNADPTSRHLLRSGISEEIVPRSILCLPESLVYAWGFVNCDILGWHT